MKIIKNIFKWFREYIIAILFIALITFIVYSIFTMEPPELCYFDVYSGSKVVDTKVFRCDEHNQALEGVYYKNTLRRAN